VARIYFCEIRKSKMAEQIAEKRKRGRPRKSLDAHRITGSLNVTRHAERLAAEVGEVATPPARRRPRELAPWAITFEYGTDYFRSLAEIGLVGHAIDDPKIRKAARDAWQRLGAEFLATREHDPHRDKPWALRKWGQPPACENPGADGKTNARGKR
jgi:hypothetical protein